MLRVRLRHVDKRRLLSLLRGREAHFRPVRARELLGEPRLHRLFVLGQLPYDDLVGNGSGRVVVAQQEVVEKVLVGNVAPAVQDELVGVDDAPLADDEHVRARNRLLAEKTHDVGVQVVGGHRMLLVGERVDGVDARLDPGGALEVEIGRCVGHLARELVEKLPVLPREEALDAAHVHGVLLGGDTPAACAGA